MFSHVSDSSIFHCCWFHAAYTGSKQQVLTFLALDMFKQHHCHSTGSTKKWCVVISNPIYLSGWDRNTRDADLTESQWDWIVPCSQLMCLLQYWFTACLEGVRTSFLFTLPIKHWALHWVQLIYMNKYLQIETRPKYFRQVSSNTSGQKWRLTF